MMYRAALKGTIALGLLFLSMSTLLLNRKLVFQSRSVSETNSDRTQKNSGNLFRGTLGWLLGWKVSDNLITAMVPVEDNYVPQSINVTEFLYSVLGDKWTEGGNFPCLHTGISTVRFPICLYLRNEDVYLSAVFHDSGYFEKAHVDRIISFFHRTAGPIYNNSISFLDIGANVGSYTLPLAHLGYSVVAIEPNKATLTRLATSIYRGNITERVKIYRVAVSNQRATGELGGDLVNRGDTFLTNCTTTARVDRSKADVSRNFLAGGSKRCWNDTVNTVLLDDLIEMIPHRRAVLKIDIQTGEVRAFTAKTASKFFREVYVPLILMEWEMYGPGFQSKDGQALVGEMTYFLTSMNYTAHDVGSGRPMTLQEWRRHGGTEVVLIRNDVTISRPWSWR